MSRVALLFLFGLACASAPGPKPPDESRRVPVNRTVPPELGAAQCQPVAPLRELRREGEVEWR